MLSMENSLDENKSNATTSKEKEFVDPLQNNQKEWVKFDEEKICTEDLPPIKQSILTDTTDNQSQISREKILQPSNDSPAVIEIEIPADNVNISQLTSVELPRQKNEEEEFGNFFFLIFNNF